MAIKDNLVSWWDLEEASGTRADSHGSNDLADNNTVGQRVGQVGDAADFVRANNEYLSQGNSGGSLNTHGGDWTYSFWYYTNQKPAGGNDYNFIDYQANISPSDDSFNIWLGTAGGTADIKYIAGDRNVENLYSGSDLTFGEWEFLTIRYDSSQNQIWARLNNLTPVSQTISQEWADSGGVQFGPDLDGGIDSLGFWDRYITSQEVDELWNGGSGVSYSELEQTTQTPKPLPLLL